MKTEKGKYYLYKHVIIATKEVFYLGIGKTQQKKLVRNQMLILVLYVKERESQQEDINGNIKYSYKMERELLNKIRQSVLSTDYELRKLTGMWFYTSNPTYEDYLYITQDVHFPERCFTKDQFEAKLEQKIKEYKK